MAMTFTFATLLLIVAFVLFVIAAFGVASGRFNLIAGGLACWTLSIILGAVTVG
jgi:hypothetical protein